MKNLFSISLVLAVSLSAQAAPSPAVAKVAEIHYQLAVAMADVRNQNLTCEAEAYVEDTLAQVHKALIVNPGLRARVKASKSLNRAFADNLAFKLMVRDIVPITLDAPAVEKAMSEGTVFYGTFSGAMGHTQVYKFLPKGEVEYKEIEILDEAPHYRWVNKKGTYSLSSGHDHILMNLAIEGRAPQQLLLQHTLPNTIEFRSTDAQQEPSYQPELTSSESECDA
jgi:hypothetical protein